MTTPAEVTAMFVEALEAFDISHSQPTDSYVNKIFEVLSGILYVINMTKRRESTTSSASIVNLPAGKPLCKRRKYLHKFHMDIVFDNCLALGGFQYVLVLVNLATRY